MSGPDASDAFHDQVHAFADGELEPAEADAFRDHLARCARCQAELDDILQLQVLSEEIRAESDVGDREPAPSATRAQPETSARGPAPRAFRPSWDRRRATLTAVLGAAVAAAIVLAVIRRPGPSDTQTPITLALHDTRGLEARLAHPLVSGHRPYDVARSGDSTPREQVPLKALVALEERGDLHGLAAVHILRGELDQARAYLERMGQTPEARSDLAVLALSQGKLEAALTILDGLLDQQPRHPQALWNRALVLRELRLDLTAAASFRTVTELGEPGWAEEAGRRADALEAQTAALQREYLAAWNAGIALALEGRPLPRGTAHGFPALARNYLYQAIWAAPSAERVRALLPLARELDALYGGDRLARYVERVAGRDFRKRGPLAEQFAQVLVRYLTGVRARGTSLEIPAGIQPFDPASAPAFFQAIQAAGDTDLLLGALPLLGQLHPRLTDYERAASALGDPWFTVNAELEKAKGDYAQGRLARAEERLLGALGRCGRDADYRCVQIQYWLADLYTDTHRLVEARKLALTGLQQARQLNEAPLQTEFLLQLGDNARFLNDFALARAYLGEQALRQPEYRPLRTYLHESLATLHIFALRPTLARAELERAFQTGAPLTLVGALVLADLARADPRPDDLERLSSVLEGLRPNLRPAQLALAKHIEGRARLTRDRAAGQALLREAIGDAGRFDRNDPDAQKARAYSYSALLLDAGKANAWADALALFAEEAGSPLPTRCVLGVEVYDEQTLIAARGADGQALGTYDAARTNPRLEVEKLVPAPVLKALEGCERVEVFARTGIHGRAGLLPPTLAWSYRTGKASQARSPAVSKHLVVSNVESPAALGLPNIKAWDAPASPGRFELTGAAATPSRVLAAMADATEVEIHAHGLVNLGISDASLLVLSPEADGEYALTAGRVRSARLNGAPVVLLAACRAAESMSPSMAAPWSLPVAFVEAGARAVIASPTDIPDREASLFFAAVLQRVRSGQPPAVAVRDERAGFLQRDARSWVRNVVVFE